MMIYRRRAGTGSRGHWLLLTAAAACLALSAPGARAQGVTGTTTGSTTNPTSTPAASPGGTASSVDVQAGNNLLSMEELAAQFYNANANKPYLAGVIATTPASGTPAPAVSPYGTTTSPTGINQPGTSSSSGNFTPFSATVGGGTGSTSANASFLLSKDQTTVVYSITVTGPATDVRIRQGPTNSNMGIVLYDLGAPANGALSGQFGIRPEDVPTLINGGMYLQVVTGPNPNDQVSGAIVLGSGATAPTPIPTAPVAPATSAFPAGVNPGALQSLVNEIHAGHNAHVMTLQQMLGTNAQPAVTFQNLDAPTLTQFLTVAQTIEDYAVGVALNGIGSASPGSSQSSLLTFASILADDARYAGGMRGFVKTVSTAVGGNPNTTLTQNGQPFNTPVTPAQLITFLQSYLSAAGNTGTGTTTGTTPTGTTSGGTPSGTTTGGTPSGGTGGTGTTPGY
jgi:hypothetical protein